MLKVDSVPQYIQKNAKRGLENLKFAGEGVTEKTKREARLMSRGEISDDKVIRMRAWFERHESDLDSPAADEFLDGESDVMTKGQVAWLLWGGDIDKENKMRARDWAAKQVEAIREEEEESYQEKRSAEMQRLTKAFDLKASEESLETGVFEGYASVFNNVDRVGDMVVKGAFKKTIEDNNGIIKLQYNHKDTIGIATIEEDDKGLKVKAAINLEVQRGREVHSLIKQGAIEKMSFAYDVLEEEKALKDGKQIFKLKELRVYEVSAVDFPANEAAEITAVKADRSQRLSQVNEEDYSSLLTGLRTYISNLKGEK